MSARGVTDSQRTFLWLMAAAIAVVGAARGAQLASLSDLGHFTKYTAAADAVLDGNPPVDRLPDLSPGYLWTVTAVRATLGRSTSVLRTLQVAALVLTAWLCAVLAARLGGRVAGAAAGAAVLALRAPLVNASEAEPETLLALLLAAALLLLLGHARPGAGRLAAAGLALGVAVVTRPTALAAALVLVLWVARAALRRAPGHAGPPTAARRGGLTVAGAAALPVLAVVAANVAVTGSASIMNPGTVFYEGMNPSATGYLGEAPRVVKEVERTLPGPDALHGAYRTVAAAALGHAVGPTEANRYWTARAAAYARAHLGAAARLVLRKAILAVHSHESWDLAPMERKDRQLTRWPWLPFGALAALAAVGAVLRRSLPPTLALVAVGLVGWATMVVFYVSSRQRCATVPALAVLAGLGVAALRDLWRSGRRRLAAAAACAAVGATLLLGHDGRIQREDRHGWDASLRAADARSLAARATDPADRRRWMTAAELATPWRAGEVSAEILRRALVGELADAASAPRRFDLALAAIRCGDWATADGVLASLDAAGYRPLRGAVVTSSLAYYRARAALRLGRPSEVAALLARAMAEAPGDPWVLALAAAVAPSQEAAATLHSRLARLHDPFTADLAMARAAADVGDGRGVQMRVARVLAALPALRSSLPALLQ